MKSEHINELAAALVKAQSELKPAHKTGKNTFYKKPDGTFHTYATLEDVWNAARQVLTSNGLSIVQYFSNDSLETMLLHTSGQYISGTCPLINHKGDMQGLASASTYARRYSLSSIIGLADDDDDANTADQKEEAEKKNPIPQSKMPSDKTGAVSFREYVCPLKKFRGKKLHEIKDYEITNYLDWIKRVGLVDPKFASQKDLFNEFIEKAEAFLTNLYKGGHKDYEQHDFNPELKWNT